MRLRRHGNSTTLTPRDVQMGGRRKWLHVLGTQIGAEGGAIVSLMSLSWFPLLLLAGATYESRL